MNLINIENNWTTKKILSEVEMEWLNKLGLKRLTLLRRLGKCMGNTLPSTIHYIRLFVRTSWVAETVLGSGHMEVLTQGSSLRIWEAGDREVAITVPYA